MIKDKKYSEFAIKLLNTKKDPACSLPVKQDVESFVVELLKLMFPHFSSKPFNSLDDIEDELHVLEYKLCNVVKPLQDDLKMSSKEISEEFFSQLSDVYDKLLLDAEAIAKNDPAASNIDEVILSYPGFLAICIYRIANIFHKLNIPLFPRVLTEYAHRETGIDIHPAAEIGSSFCIDHGTGVVIGATTIIGNNVKIYQGVTLGALSVSKHLANVKRHPTIEDNCIIYSNATILGGDTIIGHNSVIGGNVWLTSSILPYSIVYHKSEIKLLSSKDVESVINFSI